MTELQKVCVILGAGASSDVHAEGSVMNNEALRPPLAADLFDIERHNLYHSILEKYPGALYLAQPLALLSRSGQIKIEEELTRYSKHKDPIIKENFKQIPPYLRDLINYTCKNFTRTPSSYVNLIHTLMAEYPYNLLFIILNYDTLLETALKLYSQEYDFMEISRYISEHRRVKLVKLHGSINWYKPLLSYERALSWNDAIRLTDPISKISEHFFIINDSISIVSEEMINQQWVYPILTAPLASKDASSTVCPKSHIDLLKNFLKSCQKYLIIGTSGLDNDLLEILNSSLSEPMNYYHIHVVGLNQGAEECSNRFMQGVNAFKDGIPKDNVFRSGFRVYLKSDDFRSFAKFGTN